MYGIKFELIFKNSFIKLCKIKNFFTNFYKTFFSVLNSLELDNLDRIGKIHDFFVR